MSNEFGYSKPFLPKALNIVARMAGLLAYSIFYGLPTPRTWGSGVSCKKYSEFTAAGTAPALNGFPLDTHVGITISAAKIRQK